MHSIYILYSLSKVYSLPLCIKQKSIQLFFVYAQAVMHSLTYIYLLRTTWWQFFVLRTCSYFRRFFNLLFSSNIVFTKSFTLNRWCKKETQMLPFYFIQVLNGTICKRNEDCDRKMEDCKRHKDINLQICIRKIHLHF